MKNITLLDLQKGLFDYHHTLYSNIYYLDEKGEEFDIRLLNNEELDNIDILNFTFDIRVCDNAHCLYFFTNKKQLTLRKLLNDLDEGLYIKVYDKLSHCEHLGISSDLLNELNNKLDYLVSYHKLENSDYYDYYIEIK